MKRARKILLWGVLPLLLLLAIAAVGIGVWASSLLTRDSIAARIEAEKNCRVLLGSVDASLLGGSVVLEDLVLLPRDEHADNGTPLDERPDPAGSQTALRFKRVKAKAKLGDLIKKRVTVEDVKVEGMSVSFLVERDDSLSLDPLFDPPTTVKGEANPDFEEKKKRRDAAKVRRKLQPNDPKAAEIGTFNIDELPLPATLNKLVIEDGEIFMKLRKDKTRIRLYDVALTLSDLDLDPSDLVNHNSAQLEMDARLDVTARDKVTVYADLAVKAEGAIVPFDAVTGYLNPDLETNVTLLEGSEIFSLPLVERLAKALEKLRKAGLNVSDLEDTLIVREDTSVRLGWRDTMLRTADSLQVNLNGHQLVMEGGSWLHTGSNEHEINGELTFSQQISDSAFSRANAFLASLELLDPSTVKQISDMLFSPVTKNDRLYVPFVSTGDFARPKVRPRVELLDLTDLLKDEAKDNALNLLDQLIKDR